MVKCITKIGNSQGLLLDSALMEFVHLVRPSTEEISATIAGVVKDYNKTLSRLA